MFANYLEAAIVLLIMAGMGVLIWRGGAKNPVGTGGLDRKLVQVEGEIGKVKGEVIAIKSQVEAIEIRVEDIDLRAAKTSDIMRLERQLEAHVEKTNEIARALAASREDTAAIKSSVDGVRRQIDLMYQVIVEKGMKS